MEIRQTFTSNLARNCQVNELNWLNWDLGSDEKELLQFVRKTHWAGIGLLPQVCSDGVPIRPNNRKTLKVRPALAIFRAGKYGSL